MNYLKRHLFFFLVKATSQKENLIPFNFVNEYLSSNNCPSSIKRAPLELEIWKRRGAYSIKWGMVMNDTFKQENENLGLLLI